MNIVSNAQLSSIWHRVPNTNQLKIDLCELTDDELVLHLETGRVDRIAKEALATKNLIESYGATLAADRITSASSSGGQLQYPRSLGHRISILIGVIFGQYLGHLSEENGWALNPILPFMAPFILAQSVPMLIESMVLKSKKEVCIEEIDQLLQSVNSGIHNLEKINALHIKGVDQAILEERIEILKAIKESSFNIILESNASPSLAINLATKDAHNTSL